MFYKYKAATDRPISKTVNHQDWTMMSSTLFLQTVVFLTKM